MKITSVTCLLATSLALQADTLYLKDGRTLNGTFVSGTSREIRFAPERGDTQRFAVDSIQTVTFGDGSGTTASTPSGPGYDPTRARSARATIPAGTVVTVRMIDSIDSNATNAGETFRASLDEPLTVGSQTIAPKGGDTTVKVVRVQQSGRITGNEEISLVLSEIGVDGQRYAVKSNDAAVAAKSRGMQSAEVIGGTAVLGAIIGAIAGGGKGAAIGGAAGAGTGAAVQAIRGQRIQIPSESKLDFTLSDPTYIE
jgi:outer membrane lipoprotein SlyB